jgi:prolyl-tRNA synthetase
MLYSNLFGKTTKAYPKDEVSTNAKYLLKAGYVDKLMSGSYTLLTLGRLVERKIENIIREEMGAVGAQEILMPLLHPKDIWNETGRWESAKQIMYQFKKEEKEYALSFTHEEIVMDLIRKHVSSYKDLPLAIYHFSTKFRNELRAKSGILRGREFMMKDLYSAHATEEDLMRYYWEVADAYLRVFKRVGIDAIITKAAGGVFTSSHTHEFQAICDVGEDTIYMADGWKHAKNDEVMTDGDRKAPGLKAIKSIEVGNIFHLGTKYADAFDMKYLDASGARQSVWMGSYGIGVSRLLGTLAELYNDANGLKLPRQVAPFAVVVIDLTNSKTGQKVHDRLVQADIEVLLDDRDEPAGTKLVDADLIGYPIRLVHSAKTAQDGKIEIKERATGKMTLVNLEDIVKSVQKLL